MWACVGVGVGVGVHACVGRCGRVCKLCNGKAAGQDEVAAELLKYGGKVIIDWLTEVIQQVWQSRKNPR